VGELTRKKKEKIHQKWVESMTKDPDLVFKPQINSSSHFISLKKKLQKGQITDSVGDRLYSASEQQQGNSLLKMNLLK
jgi:hypothetical protein